MAAICIQNKATYIILIIIIIVIIKQLNEIRSGLSDYYSQTIIVVSVNSIFVTKTSADKI